MPLTFAHPAVVLPFAKESKYVNVLALVLGSMAPDFEYFLRGMPSGALGHSFIGFICFNLPIVLIVYFIYLKCVHKTLFAHLPAILQLIPSEKVTANKGLQVVVFLYSVLFGMLTHVIWDSFTHLNGVMVRKLSILTNTVSILDMQIPIYKFLQHGSTLIGITAIIGFMVYRAAKHRPNKAIVSSKQKWLYWSQITLLSLLLFCLWCIIVPIPITAYGILVVRIIDAACISVLIVSLYYKYSRTKVQLQNNA
jgi:hypothetical protein